MSGNGFPRRARLFNRFDMGEQTQTKRSKSRLLFLSLLLLFCGGSAKGRPVFYYVDYSAEIDPQCLRAYDLSILSPYAKADLAAAHEVGNTVLAYISVGEIASDAPYRQEALQRQIKLGGKNTEWQSDLVDLSDPAWAPFVTNLAAQAVEKGFDGFFLDTLDTVDALSEQNPSKARAYRQGLVRVVRALKAAFPEKKIIVNRGFAVVDQIRDSIDGLLVESLFRTYDSAEKTYGPVAPGVTEELLSRLKPWAKQGLPIYILDYMDPQQPEEAQGTARKIEALGFHALISTIDLQGNIIAPLRPVARHVLTLFGNRAAEIENMVKWPADTAVGNSVQAILEWLGYEVDYLNVVSNMPPPRLDPKYCAILLDRFLEIPPERESSLADFLIAQQKKGLKLIFLGDLPFEQDDQRERLLRALNIRGDGVVVPQPKDMAIEEFSDSVMDFEAKVRLIPNNFRDLEAPAGSQVYLGLSARDDTGRVHHFHPIFTTSWGGIALDPYLRFRRPDFYELWLLDPFKFFSAALRVSYFPAPDPTTRDGLRLFYSHIDGDGFGNGSVVEPGKRSAEVIRDRILKVYPVPVTVSVIEAEIRGRIEGQTEEDEKDLTAIARSIFKLPNVQAGSHTYTHPFYWMESDRTSINYEGQTLVLRAPFNREELNTRREVLGSIDYVQHSLLPPGKKFSIFLWSGNCRPSPAALRYTRELGVENMNGGDTLMSGKFPSLTSVAPRVMQWGDELQIYAANQNENEFNNDWQGPYYGGYIHVIETFKRTESPRRLKPMNLYYHFYSADYHDSFRVLNQAYRFVLSQPCHAVTAAHFARITRDSHFTDIFRQDDRHWLLANLGELRTFRLPQNGLLPDLNQCRGVTGYHTGQNVIYIHTDGSPRVELVLAKDPPRHPFLISSTAEIGFEKLALDGVRFTTTDYRPARVELGGLGANTQWRVDINGEPRASVTDADGRLRLDLPAEARVDCREVVLAN